MSKRTEELEAQVVELQQKLADARDEVAEVSGANGRLAAKLDARDLAIVELTEQRDTAIAAVEAMRVEDQAAGFAS